MKKTFFATALLLIVAVVTHSQAALPAIDKSPWMCAITRLIIPF